MEPSAAISETLQLGSYRLLRQIGMGGMGSVWLAEHRELGRRAAIKVLHPDFSNRPDVVRRFFNEARAATAIGDPGIVQIFDFGRHSDGSAYIVMELLEGEGLDRRLARRGPLPVVDALRIIRQVASALAAAHARGIIHRDLKPENIFLARDCEVASGERAKILDFGIAKVVSGPASMRTNTDAIIGTPFYMSPEQCRGAGDIDHRSDLYSLGCVLFTLLTGTPPFVSEGAGELIAMHICAPPPAASTLNAAVPAGVDALIARCLAKKPESRFESAEALASSLAALELGLDPFRSVTPVPDVADVMPLEESSDDDLARKNTTLSSSAGSSTPLPAPRIGRKLAMLGASLLLTVVATWTVARAGATSEPAHASVASKIAPVVAPAAAPVPDEPKIPPTPAAVLVVQPAAPISAPPAITEPVAPIAPAVRVHHHTTKKASSVTSTSTVAEPAFDDDGMPTHR